MSSVSMDQPYAPLQSYRPLSGPRDEVKLYDSAKDRDVYEALAEVYSIVVTLDVVEKAYIRDTISTSDYSATCQRLLTQYSSILKNEDVAREFGSLDEFKRKYDMTHSHATSRLKIGVPATVEHAIEAPQEARPTAPASSSTAVSARAVSEATGNFITVMDGLKLNLRAKDQLHPILSELMKSLNKVTNNRDFEGRGKLVQWLIRLNGMRANEELDDDQVREFLFDLDTAYKAFFATLE